MFINDVCIPIHNIKSIQSNMEHFGIMGSQNVPCSRPTEALPYLS